MRIHPRSRLPASMDNRGFTGTKVRVSFKSIRFNGLYSDWLWLRKQPEDQSVDSLGTDTVPHQSGPWAKACFIVKHNFPSLFCSWISMQQLKWKMLWLEQMFEAFSLMSLNLARFLLLLPPPPSLKGSAYFISEPTVSHVEQIKSKSESQFRHDQSSRG